MNRATSRTSFLSLFAALIILLFMVIVFAARAQVTGVATPMFQPAVNYSSGGFNSSALAVADLNGDGKLDVVITNSCRTYDDCPFNDVEYTFGQGTVGVLLGNGNGTFRPVVVYDTAYQSPLLSPSVAVGDLNGDDKPDIVVTTTYWTVADSMSEVHVLMGNGDGTFFLAASYDSGGWAPVAVAIGDISEDGKPDLLVANTCYERSVCDVDSCSCARGSVGILLNDGYGNFRSGGTLDTGGPWSRYLVLADVNGDSKNDVLVANDASVSVLLNAGHGSFQAAKLYGTAGTRTYSVSVGDVNGDHKPDLVVANWSGLNYTSSATVGLLLGNGDGTFQQPVPCLSGGPSPYSIAIGDLNGDDKADLAIATGADVRVLIGNGNGSFNLPVPFSSAGYGPSSVVMADVNGDGKLDLIAANTYGTTAWDGSVAVLIGNKGISNIALTSSLNPSFAGQTVTFKAVVSSKVGIPLDGEIVTFRSGSVVLGSSALGAGVASLTTSSLMPKTQAISATYAGDANFQPSTGRLTQVVNGYTTSVTVASSLNPSIYGQPVIWTAMVKTSGPTPPAGNFTFRWSRDGRNFNIGTAPLNASGLATLTRSNLNADPTGDPYPLVAVYSGDAMNLGSTSAILSQDVLQAKSTASITSSLNPSKHGQAVTLTAKITSPTVVVTGPVTFSMGYTVLGTAKLEGGVARFTTSSLPLGSDRIKMTYAGDSNVASSSASFIQSVQ